MAAIAELGYRPNLSARSLRSGRTGEIVLMIPELRNAYFAELAEDVMLAASGHALTTVIELTGGERERELAILNSPRLQSADGALFNVLGLDAREVGQLNIATPLVLLGEHVIEGPHDLVTMRNVEAAKAATKHLIDKGRRRIVALGAAPNEDMGSSTLRLRGYLAALDEAGVVPDSARVVSASTWDRRGGGSAMQRVIDDGIEFDAVFAFNDVLGLGAMKTVQDAGLSVSRDVAVIGFDDIDDATWSSPTMSTIDPGRLQVAKLAVEVLVERIADSGNDWSRKELYADFRLIERESTAR
jgi:DNA-binding LacI/PurR family transcriptional regulator